MIRHLAALALGLTLALPAQADTPAKQLFAKAKLPSTGRSLAIGAYAKGCLAGAAELAESGPTWQAMRLSRNRHYGTPELVSFIQSYSARVARLPGWSGIYVGDMAQPRGGPMLGGHASHQTGLDVDIWLDRATRLNLSAADREKISASNFQRAKGAYVNSDWTPQHMQMVRLAAEDPAVERVFIFAGAKVQMCKDAKGNRAWLRKVRPWWGHNDHIHVRLTCPRGMRGCSDQDSPPPGDGCDEAQQWVDNILNPPKPKPGPKPKPTVRRELVLADLPKQCAKVLSAD